MADDKNLKDLKTAMCKLSDSSGEYAIPIAGIVSDLIAQMIDLLRKHQWVDYDATNYCPECSQAEHRGHAPDCAIAEILDRVTIDRGTDEKTVRYENRP